MRSWSLVSEYRRSKQSQTHSRTQNKQASSNRVALLALLHFISALRGGGALVSDYSRSRKSQTNDSLNTSELTKTK